MMKSLSQGTEIACRGRKIGDEKKRKLNQTENLDHFESMYKYCSFKVLDQKPRMSEDFQLFLQQIAMKSKTFAMTRFDILKISTSNVITIHNNIANSNSSGFLDNVFRFHSNSNAMGTSIGTAISTIFIFIRGLDKTHFIRIKHSIVNMKDGFGFNFQILAYQN